MTTTDIVYNILARHHELTVGEIRKKTDFANPKAISNALTRLKKEGRVESVYDEDRGLWLWHIVRESPVASSECAMRIGSTMAVPPEDHFSHTEEMASDVAEIEQQTASRFPFMDAILAEDDARITTSNVVNHDAECRAKPRKPYTPNKIAGAYSYRGALVIKLDRKAHAKSITLSAKDMAMLTSIFGGVA